MLIEIICSVPLSPRILRVGDPFYGFLALLAPTFAFCIVIFSNGYAILCDIRKKQGKKTHIFTNK
jgi:hypothetical protein